MGAYSLFFPVRGHEPKLGPPQPMTKARLPGYTHPRAPDHLSHPVANTPAAPNGEIKAPPALMSQMLTEQRLLARHREDGREPREERQTGKEPTEGG